ncbi:YtxH domain-containing protein [Mucilaginibacter jinjuensis]|jgi:vacuolar-type H+-ATPase subunit H|uniref:YtxH domain-containing protein n=1 Tax=Mucilaginibacter jinjuensis TaxID=1176721 RepID=A0ABY7TAW7_9SPHI|nr:YtxH domain-containing protein [Mucilaginibacter jinjuensis]WCT13225.1 YtxH domain-containing protein [Mucilaginibacter jinjuensis]
MNLLKYIAIGAAVAYGISYVVKKNESEGKSLIDELADKAPDLVDKLKSYAKDALEQITDKAKEAKASF